MSPCAACCHLSMVPMRAAASHRSEMVNQILFGEWVELLYQEKDWYRVRTLFDQYEGFVDTNQLLLSREMPSSMDLDRPYYQHYPVQAVSLVSKPEDKVDLSFGTLLPPLEDNCFFLSGIAYCLELVPLALPRRVKRERLAETAQAYLGAPYLWGGRGIFGIDCSGLVQQVFRLNGVSLPRDAAQQAQLGEVVASMEEVLPGDLAFFGDNGIVTHVGLLLGRNTIIHASGSVKIDRFDSDGIRRASDMQLSHKLIVIKNLL